MKNTIFIVEGQKDEPRFLKKMWKLYFRDDMEVYSYNTNIHVLIDALFANGNVIDRDVDIIRHLKDRERDAEKIAILSMKYVNIFLVFDMDPHDQKTDIGKLRTMLSFFGDPTDNGKLYLNYPMLESYKHLKHLNDPEFAERKIKVSDVCNYKRIVGEECCAELENLGAYTQDVFKILALMHLKKANRVLGGNFGLPSKRQFLSWTGEEILDTQRAVIEGEQSLFVLNTCLFNIVDHRPSDFLSDTE
jgi:hypothetical protein